MVLFYRLNTIDYDAVHDDKKCRMNVEWPIYKLASFRLLSIWAFLDFQKTVFGPGPWIIIAHDLDPRMKGHYGTFLYYQKLSEFNLVHSITAMVLLFAIP